MTEEAEKIFINVDFNKESKFIGRSVESGLPVTAPLDSLEELLSWEPHDPDDAGQKFSISTVQHYGKKIPKGSTKTLVCHDMAGGYIDDRFVQGTVCKDDKWYYLAYWDVIDTFVYFSHHFVTIPPVGWINCAHANGVAVLGTFITEWDVGYRRCKAFLTSEFAWKAVADKLVEIAKHYQFEGWLINIENKINLKHVESLREFLHYLTNRMHAAVPGSQVIWYDSVTKEGTLVWQNALNKENRTFFAACDGIFLNYGWSEKSLKHSAEVASELSRVQDVYVGIDVFGRGCYGGGGMNCGVALEVIRRYELSAAIFAPGWVKEVLGSENFEENQRKFWDTIAPYCKCHTLLTGDKNMVATHYSTGMNLVDQKLRFLHLTEQQSMPALSSSMFEPLPMVHADMAGSVTVNAKASAVLCKSRLRVTSGRLFLSLHGKSSRLKLTLKISPVHSEEDISTAVLTVHSVNRFNSCAKLHNPSEGIQIQQMYDGGVIISQPFIFHELSCESEQRTAQIHSLTLYPMPGEEQKSTETPLKDSGIHMIKMYVMDATWEKSPSDAHSLLLTCTLRFDNVDDSRMCDIFYRTPNTEFLALGSACSDRYRINKLAVPNPVFHGPSARLFLKAQQKCTVPMAKPSNKTGLLEITYAENIRDGLEAN